MNRVPSLAGLAIAATMLVEHTGIADETEAPRADVAASVDGEPILASEVDRALAEVTRGRDVDPETLENLRRETLQKLIDQRLVVRWMTRTKQGVSDREVDLAIDRLTKQLAKREQTLDAHLRQLRMTKPELRRTLQWRLGWQRVLDRYLTDKNLESYFTRNQRHFDGTRFRVAHILLKIDGDEQKVMQRAKQIRKEIVADEITFEDAARQHSAAPTAADGGSIGFITRHDTMPEAFSRVAFSLKKDEVSEPVLSPFGLHLIKCLDIEPGQGTWQDARRELRRAVIQYLFEFVADKERRDAKIKVTSADP